MGGIISKGVYVLILNIKRIKLPSSSLSSTQDLIVIQFNLALILVIIVNNNKKEN